MTAIYPLIGSLINDNFEDLVVTKFRMYTFELITGHSKIRLYTLKKEEKDKWVQYLKEAIGYSNLTDFYVLDV